MELVNLTTCWNSFEAELIKSKLDAAGIACILTGEGISSVKIGNGYGNSAFNIPILVRVEDLEEAKKILSEKEEV